MQRSDNGDGAGSTNRLNDGGGEGGAVQRMARCGGGGCVGYRHELRGDEGEGDGGDDQPCNGQTTAAARAARIG